jgi:hypothetical protein
MNLLAPVDIYCERTDPSFWSEPVNAISNLAFIIAAYYAWRLYKSRTQIIGHSSVPPLLCAVVACVGMGSFLFHSFANQWSMIADVLFIAIFMFVYIGAALRQIFAMRALNVALSLVLFFAMGQAYERIIPPAMFNGSESYFAAITMLCAIIIASFINAKPHSATLVAALIAFCVSIFFRSMDMAWCDPFPLGVHFLWHLLNGLVLALLMRYLILNYPSNVS